MHNLSIYIYIYIYIYVYVCTHTHACIYIYTHICVCIITTVELRLYRQDRHHRGGLRPPAGEGEDQVDGEKQQDQQTS